MTKEIELATLMYKYGNNSEGHYVVSILGGPSQREKRQLTYINVDADFKRRRRE